MTPGHRRVAVPIAVVAGLGAAAVLMVLVGLAVRVPWSSLVTVVRSAAVLDALRLSMVTASAAAVVAVLFGLPIAWVLARHDGSAARLLRVIVLVPMVLPPVVAGVALLAAFGRRGVFGSFGAGLPFTTTAVVIAQSFVALPFVVLAIEAGARSFGAEIEEAAAACGAGPWYRFVHVVLPMLRPSIAAASLLAWARALGEFGATVTFAGNVPGRTQTLPLAVVTALQEDPDVAVAISVVLLAMSLSVLVALRGRWTGLGRGFST